MHLKYGIPYFIHIKQKQILARYFKKNKKKNSSKIMIKCNYSEKLNSLQAQTGNVHLCHHFAIGECHFEPIPLQTY